MNEFFEFFAETPVTSSAYTQARANLSHELFKDANHEIYKELYYEEEDTRKYKGHRILAIDGSHLRLPEEAAVTKEFGTIRLKNQYETGEYTSGLCSVLYDVLNDIALDSILSGGKSSERDLASRHLEHVKANDLIIFDRGYPSFKLFKEVTAKQCDFIFRCKQTAFKAVKDFMLNEQQKDIIVEIKEECAEESFKVRLVKVFLKNNEIEILATSLLDKDKYPRNDFKRLYAFRWNIETYYDRVKNRLGLENFTGKTVESIYQDFYATILITNFESDITKNSNKKLENNFKKGTNKYQYKVNKAVSFNAIKNHVLELFFAQDFQIDLVMQKLEKLFLFKKTAIHDDRSFPRNKTTIRKTLNFGKYAKKLVF